MMDFNKNKFIRFKEYVSPAHHHHRHYSMRESFESGKIRGCLNVVQRGWNKGCEMTRKSFIQRRRRQPSSSKSSELDQAAAQILSNTDEKHNNVIDPNSNFLQQWNKGMLILCLFALALDPLFFYIPVIDLTKKCLDFDKKMQTAACILRTIVDVFYVSHIVIQFHTGFIPRSSQVFGRGDLVDDRFAIARRYLSSYFFLDILAILPLPQIMLLWVIHLLPESVGFITKESLQYIILSQCIPRIGRIYPIYKQVKSTSGFLTQTPWAGAAFNLFLYMLASHAAGALWYLISVERQKSCWHETCYRINGCHSDYLYCDKRVAAMESDLVHESMKSSCPLDNSDDITNPTTFDFGIFIDALRSRVVASKKFRQKLLYCFWWGFRNLSSLGQDLKTSLFVGEIVFATGLSIAGLVLFALLIGNMQTYLQSISVRIEEMRVKRRDAELWMSHRMLPDDMRKRVHRYQQDKWQQNRGVEEEGLIKNLPKDLRRDIKRHLCLTSLMRVPLFKKMDEQLTDAMCDRLKPVLFTEKSTIVREGDTVDEILFIIRGKALTKTTNYGGRNGFFHTDVIKVGDLCGEELLTWALDPNSTLHHLPASTQTVYTISQLEAFALEAEDFKFVASQFSKRLHSKQLQHTFRFHSQQWKTWGACCIQAAWRNYIKRKKEKALCEAEQPLLLFNSNIITNLGVDEQGGYTKSSSPTTTPISASINAIRFVPHLHQTLRSNLSSSPSSGRNLSPHKPNEPNFGNQ